MRAHTHTLTHPYIYTYCTFNSHNTLQTTIESKKKKNLITGTYISPQSTKQKVRYVN